MRTKRVESINHTLLKRAPIPPPFNTDDDRFARGRKDVTARDPAISSRIHELLIEWVGRDFFLGEDVEIGNEPGMRVRRKSPDARIQFGLVQSNVLTDQDVSFWSADPIDAVIFPREYARECPIGEHCHLCKQSGPHLGHNRGFVNAVDQCFVRQMGH